MNPLDGFSGEFPALTPMQKESLDETVFQTKLNDFDRFSGWLNVGWLRFLSLLSLRRRRRTLHLSPTLADSG